MNWDVFILLMFATFAVLAQPGVAECSRIGFWRSMVVMYIVMGFAVGSEWLVGRVT